MSGDIKAESGVSVAGLRKSYGSSVVLDGVDIEFRAGAVHALLGPNGAGKSTLLGCLSGAVSPDDGTIRISGQTHTGFTPAGAFDAGTAIIYQHFQLVGALSVSENIFLGSELRSPVGTIRRKAQDEIARGLLAELDVDFDVTSTVETLSVGQQQIVEIARALHHSPSLLILDEPTAALSPQEVESLLVLVRRLAAERGLAVIYVTHLLREVLAVADEVTILRDGAVLWNRATVELTMNDLVEAISPAAAAETRSAGAIADGDCLVLSGLSGRFANGIDLEVRGGEIVAVFGLLGSGRTDLLETVCGLRPVVTGQLTLDGAQIKGASRRKVAYVPADRNAQAMFGELSAEENLLMPHYGRMARGLRSPADERSIFARVAEQVNLQPRDPRRPASTFSGGNAQKISVGRWLVDDDALRLLVLDEPTQGVDIGSRREIYALLGAFVSSGDRAVLFATSDPDEVVALADRVIVLAHGRPVGIHSAQIGEAALLSLAHGQLTHDRDRNTP